jgi:FdhD protein
VEIAQAVGVRLIGRLRGRRFVCLGGEERLVRDAHPESAGEEDGRNRRKGAGE